MALQDENFLEMALEVNTPAAEVQTPILSLVMELWLSVCEASERVQVIASLRTGGFLVIRGRAQAVWSQGADPIQASACKAVGKQLGLGLSRWPTWTCLLPEGQKVIGAC